MNYRAIALQAPSFGAWLSYALGTENQNLPGYVVLNNDWVPNGGLENVGSSFLPASHQATMMRAKGVPVHNIVPVDTTAVQRRELPLLAEQDTTFAAQSSDAQARRIIICMAADVARRAPRSQNGGLVRCFEPIFPIWVESGADPGSDCSPS
jgi:hypothetical protein